MASIRTGNDVGVREFFANGTDRDARYTSGELDDRYMEENGEEPIRGKSTINFHGING